MTNRELILPLVLHDLSFRVATGTRQYGEPLTSHNGRDALWDAYEEALDLALYLRQAIAERDPKVGYTACWKYHGTGLPCRQPIGHDSEQEEAPIGQRRSGYMASDRNA